MSFNKEDIRRVSNSNLVSLVKEHVIRYKLDNTKRKMKFTIFALLLAVVVFATDATEDRPSCLCTRELAPVCATDGVTYSNQCEFNCAKNRLQGRAADNLKIARGGDCNGPEIPQFVRDLK